MEVQVPPLSLAGLQGLLKPSEWDEFQTGMQRASVLLSDREIWNVNSTASGGGVAEMLRSWVGYARGIGVDMRWTAIGGTPEFFVLTKRLHNFLHGAPGDEGLLGPDEVELYERVATANAEDLVPQLRERDIVMLHDPQTAGLIPRLKQTGATVLWRSHIGAEDHNEYVEAAWEFISGYVTQADACVFTREAYVPPWAEDMVRAIIPPSIDVLAPKNQEMDAQQVQAILRHTGLVLEGPSDDGASPAFTHHDGTPGRVNHMCDVQSTGPPPGPDNPLIVQISRWDRLKDPTGVMAGFAEGVIDGTDAHLILAGPSVHSVADDPEGAQVLDETQQAWRDLPRSQRSRVHLACLPMEDIEENAAIVNALQRAATIVVQKSVEEGFGLTVAEAMWKARPVVASAVGGIRDQIDDGVNGILLEDPRDLAKFGAETLALLKDPDRAREMGWKAREHVREYFLENRHTLQYVRLFERLLG